MMKVIGSFFVHVYSVVLFLFIFTGSGANEHLTVCPTMVFLGGDSGTRQPVSRH
jgi:hypothetical protein